MSERHVTAVVLLSRSTSADSLDALRDSLDEQTRAPDRVLAVVPAGLEESVRARVEADRASGRVDELVPVSDALNRAGRVREAFDAVLAPQDPAGTSAEDPDDAPEHAGRGGRRAREVDAAAIERERTQRAEDLAQVPQRLREPRPRSGRRAAAGEAGERWVWFVEDGATPAVDALEHQLEIARDSPSTAAVGAKRVRHASPEDVQAPHRPDGADQLVDVGLTLTHSGAVLPGVDPGEIDQGQADWRQDVLAVPLPGMLVREQTLREVGSLDPDLPAPWAEIDLCRRIWHSGEKVAVQASARVLHPHPSRPLGTRLREQRTGRLLVLLKHRGALSALLTLVLLPLVTLLRMLGAIAATAPRAAGRELRAAAAVLPRARRVMSRGRRDHRRARVPRGRLAPLYLPRGAGLRRWFDDTWTRHFADDDRRRQIRRTSWGVAGTRHGLDDADYGRHIVWTVVLALVATTLGLFTLRSLFGRGELTGPGLSPLPEDRADLWQVAWSSWIPDGLGERGPADALIRLLGHLPIDGSLLVEAVVFAALPLSALAAWWASGALTRAVGARLVLAVVWALAPSLVTALAIGAWPLLIVHCLLPLLALAVGRAVGLPHKISQASVPAAAAGGLLLLVIGAVQPVLVLLTAAALVVVAIAVPGRRLRLLWVLLPSLALHAPYLPVLLGHPEALLAVSGVPARPHGVTELELLGLWPVGPGIQQQLVPLVGELGATLLVLLPVAPVVLAALAAPFLIGPAGRVGRCSLLLTALAVATVLLSRRTEVEVGEQQLLTAPLHALLSAVLLALAIGAGASFDALARREAHDSRSRRTVTGLVGTAVAAACVVTVAGWVLLLPGQLQVERVESGAIPAAAADQGRTDARSRVLVLDQQEDGSVTARLVVHGQDTAAQHAAVLDARDLDAIAAGQAVDGDPGSAALRTAVAEMLVGGSSGAPAAEEQSPSHLAISYVVVRGDPEQQATLMGTLDSSPLLEKVTESAGGGMWRIIAAEPRAVVVGGEDPVPLASRAVTARGEIPPADAERTVVLSERFDTGWRASLEGTELEPVPVSDWAQGFTVPAGEAGEVVIQRDQPLRLLWQVLLWAAIAVTAVISIPWRIRSRTVEEMYG